LLKSGYKIINNKLYDKNNNQITIEFLIDQKAFEMVVAPFIKNLKKIGIDAKMRFVEENQYQTRVNNFDFDIIVGGLPNAIIPGNELYGYLHSSQKNIKGSMNLMGLDDKIVDELVEKIARTKNINELKLLCAKLDEHLLKNHYAILQWYNDKYRILYRNIFSFPDVTPKYSLAIDSWWIKN
jgi:microcin C transport system substrate-binding protein